MNEQFDPTPTPDASSDVIDLRLKELCEGVGRIFNQTDKERDLGDILSSN